MYKAIISGYSPRDKTQYKNLELGPCERLIDLVEIVARFNINVVSLGTRTWGSKFIRRDDDTFINKVFESETYTFKIHPTDENGPYSVETYYEVGDHDYWSDSRKFVNYFRDEVDAIDALYNKTYREFVVQIPELKGYEQIWSHGIDEDTHVVYYKRTDSFK